ncbi:sulfotransferase domain-containing protein [Desulfobacter curvatus]|uniref:sulfotransferase domain-containing protein n=1 Tax=Desulfobacter curvatus TaxID=2290 RepID=UPI0003684C8C|nr:sulfotransferase domain-containing protein [Desulfobacter curvatus]
MVKDNDLTKKKYRRTKRNFIFASKLLVRNLYFSTRKICYQKNVLPNVIIIGAQKSGTSFLFNTLSSHFEVSAALVKETHYFDWNYYKGVSYYKAHFASCCPKKIVLEATPNYLFQPLVPSRINNTLSGCKFICLLREPVSRAFSQWRMEYHRGYEHLSFENAIERELDNWENWYLETKSNQNHIHWHHLRHAYLHRGCYAPQLERWYKYIPKKDILVIGAGEMRSNTHKTLEKIQQFLGIKIQSLKIPININTGPKGYHLSPKTQQWLSEWYLNGKLRPLIGWYVANRYASEAAGKLSEGHFMHIRYEDLCSNPAKIALKLENFLNLPNGELSQFINRDIVTKGMHSAMGNPLRHSKKFRVRSYDPPTSNDLNSLRFWSLPFKKQLSVLGYSFHYDMPVL